MWLFSLSVSNSIDPNRVDPVIHPMTNNADFIWSRQTVAAGDTAVLHCSFDAIFSQLRNGNVSTPLKHRHTSTPRRQSVVCATRLYCTNHTLAARGRQFSMILIFSHPKRHLRGWLKKIYARLNATNDVQRTTLSGCHGTMAELYSMKLESSATLFS